VKRKRGRAKASNSSREKREPTGEEMPEFEEDSAEDSYESEDEESSDEDVNISPRGTSSTTSSSKNPSANSESIMQTHTFHLGGSNPSSNSNLHHEVSSSPAAKSSISKSNANSSVSLSNSSSTLPTLKERLHAEDSNVKERGKEIKRNTADAPFFTNSDCSDGAAMGDFDMDPAGESENGFEMEDNAPFPNSGVTLALLLPLIGNLSNINDDQAMSLDDEFNSRLECEETSFMSGSSPRSFEIVESYDHNSANLFNIPSEASSFNSKVWSNDFSFYSNSSAKSRNFNEVEEGDSRAQIYLKECWEEFQQKYRTKNMDAELQQANDKWKDILKCLRNLDWQKAQCLIEEMERTPGEHFGEHVQPSIVCWTSGGRIHYVNEAFCNLVGFEEDELRVDDLNTQQFNSFTHAFGSFGLYKDKVRIHSIFHPEEMMKITKRQLEAVQHPEKSSFQLNTRLLSKSRNEIPISCSILNLRDSSALPLLTIAVFV